MTAQFLVVDSCSYLRLAAHVHPNFWGGHPEYELRGIVETNPEVAGKRLLTKFVWPNRDPHPGLRNKWLLPITKTQRKAIDAAQEFLLDHSEAVLEDLMAHRRKQNYVGEDLPFLSPVDLTVLGTAYHFQYGILTDERALTLVANSLSLPTMSSLQMLGYFHSKNFIDAAKVDAVILRWHAQDDLPRYGWAADFKKVFKREPPPLPPK